MARSTAPTPTLIEPPTPSPAERLAEARATKAGTSAARIEAQARVQQLRALAGGVDGQREVAVSGVTYGSLSGVVTTDRVMVPVAADQSPEALALVRLSLPSALHDELLAVVGDQRAESALREAIRVDRAERVARLTPVVQQATREFYAALDRFIQSDYLAFVTVLDGADAELGDRSLTADFRWPELDTADAGSLISFRRRMFGIA